MRWLLAWAMLSQVGARGPHHPGGHYHYKPIQGGPKLTQDTQLLQDTEHIHEDLSQVMSKEAINQMSSEEREFYYFKLHDFDNNTKLDGLEMLQAIRHTVEHEESKQEKYQTGEAQPSMTNENIGYFIDLIDQVLAEDDTDNDGYLSYIEYVIGRQRDSSIRANANNQH